METKNIRWSYLVLLLALFVAPSMQQRSELDLVFVVDGSDSIGQANFETLKQSILNYVVPQMGNGALHVGFVLYSTNLDTIINLTPDVATLTNGVNALDWPQGETNTNIGLQWGLSVLMTTSTRPGVPQVMIVVVDGVSRFPSDTQSVAEFTRNMNVEVYAVGVGPDVSQTELFNIAGATSRVLNTNSFANLPAIDLQLDNGGGGVTAAPPTVPPTTPTTPTTTTPITTTPTTTTPTTTTTRPTTPTTRPTTPTTRPTTRPTAPTTRPTTRATTPTTRPTTRPTTPTTRPTTRPPVTTRPTTPFRPITRTTTRAPVATTTRRTLPPRTTTERVTTTTRKAPSTPFVQPYLEGLCKESKIIDGIGYLAHPYEADKYVQCYFPNAGLSLAVIRECPFGTLWNSHARLCDPFLRVSLANDPCEDKEASSHPHEGNCRTFYNCEGGRSVPRCCPQGYLYNAILKGCAPCNGCQDPCPAMCAVQALPVYKYPVFDDDTVYRKWTRDGYVLAPCQNGTRFSPVAGDCVEYNNPAVCTPGFDVPLQTSAVPADVVNYEDIRQVGVSGRFDGPRSRLSVRTEPSTPYDRPLVLRLTFREAEEIKKPMAVVTNSLCPSGGLFMVSLHRDHIKVEMSSYGRTPIIIRLPTAGFKTSDLKDVLLTHDGDHLTVSAKSGSLVYSRRSKVAVLPYLNCGLDFGASKLMNSFNGVYSKIQLLRCTPADY